MLQHRQRHSQPIDDWNVIVGQLFYLELVLKTALYIKYQDYWNEMEIKMRRNE
jgi:hypothetical protein